MRHGFLTLRHRRRRQHAEELAGQAGEHVEEAVGEEHVVAELSHGRPEAGTWRRRVKQGLESMPGFSHR